MSPAVAIPDDILAAAARAAPPMRAIPAPGSAARDGLRAGLDAARWVA
ncbi:hypothetical protein ACW7GZ_08115 [Luteimonas sp. A537]